MTANPLLDKLMTDLGGKSYVAKALGVDLSTVHHWFDDGLPPIIRLLELSDLAAKSKIYIDIERIARASDSWKARKENRDGENG